jgi:hypothetical protein
MTWFFLMRRVLSFGILRTWGAAVLRPYEEMAGGFFWWTGFYTEFAEGERGGAERWLGGEVEILRCGVVRMTVRFDFW